MSLLIITLPPDAADTAALFDYVLSPDGSTVSSHASVPRALLPASDRRTGEVLAVVPAHLLSWHQVQLPQGSLPRSMLGERGVPRLRAILDGLLEDQLLDDPAQLHLALQPQPDTTGPVWVAACDRAWLKAALSALAAAGHEVSRILPEFTPQSLMNTLYVTGDADAARLSGVLVTSEGKRAGVVNCAWSNASVAMFEAGLAHVVAEPAVAALAEQTLKRPVTLQHRAQRQLQAAQSAWDLAQFDLAHTSRDRRWALLAGGFSSFLKAPSWRPARWALLAVVMGNLIGLNAWALREQSSLTAQRAQVRAVLTDTFPKIPVVVDAPLQMAREVAALQRASGSLAGTDLESMLSSFSAVVPVGYALDAIEYGVAELRLSGPALTPEAQLQVVAGMKAAGLTATLQGEQWLIRAGVMQ
jgi:general secretion pathway protein L